MQKLERVQFAATPNLLGNDREQKDMLIPDHTGPPTDTSALPDHRAEGGVANPYLVGLNDNRPTPSVPTTHQDTNARQHTQGGIWPGVAGLDYPHQHSPQAPGISTHIQPAIGVDTPDRLPGAEEKELKPLTPSIYEGGYYRFDSPSYYQGIPLMIENPAGSIRSGKEPDGHQWQTHMLHDYGYIQGVDGADGEELDCYVGPDPTSNHVYVIHQNCPDTGEYDEDKVMMGFKSEEEAKEAYLKHYDRPGYLGPISSVPIDQFKSYLNAKGEGDIPFAWKPHKRRGDKQENFSAFVHRLSHTMFIAQRSPIGGVEVQSTFYPGGQFIPAEVVAEATPEEKQAIEEGPGPGEPAKPPVGLVEGDLENTRPEFKQTLGSGIRQPTLTKWEASLERSEFHAIRMFTADGYIDMRRAQRGEGVGVEKAKERADLMEAAMAKAKGYKGIVWRGMSMSREQSEAFFTDLQNKSEMILDAMSSSSKLKSVAEGFTKRTLGSQIRITMKIKNRTGVDVSRLATMSAENEVVLRKASRYQIIDLAETETDDFLMTLEEI